MLVPYHHFCTSGFAALYHLFYGSYQSAARRARAARSVWISLPAAPPAVYYLWNRTPGLVAGFCAAYEPIIRYSVGRAGGANFHCVCAYRCLRSPSCYRAHSSLAVHDTVPAFRDDSSRIHRLTGGDHLRHHPARFLVGVYAVGQTGPQPSRRAVCWEDYQ